MQFSLSVMSVPSFSSVFQIKQKNLFLAVSLLIVLLTVFINRCIQKFSFVCSLSFIFPILSSLAFYFQLFFTTVTIIGIIVFFLFQFLLLFIYFFCCCYMRLASSNEQGQTMMRKAEFSFLIHGSVVSVLFQGIFPQLLQE